MRWHRAIKELGYTHREVYRQMTPRGAHALWLAIPDPDLEPKQSDDPMGLLGFVM